MKPLHAALIFISFLLVATFVSARALPAPPFVSAISQDSQFTTSCGPGLVHLSGGFCNGSFQHSSRFLAWKGALYACVDDCQATRFAAENDLTLAAQCDAACNAGGSMCASKITFTSNACQATSMTIPSPGLYQSTAQSSYDVWCVCQ